MENVLIQTFWIGDRLSNLEILSLKSFLDFNHEVHLYSYGNIINLPDNIVLMDANEVLNIEIFNDLLNLNISMANISDLFRYKMLYLKGGWWVDTDIICLKNFNLIEDELVISSSWEYQWGEVANNCVLKFSRYSPLVKYLYDTCFINIKNIKNYCDTGPFLVQSLVKQFNLYKNVVPFYYFNPISWRHVATRIVFKNVNFLVRTKDYFRPVFKPTTLKGLVLNHDSFSVHLWNNEWSKNHLNKNDSYSKSCLFEKLKIKHRING